MYFFQELFPEYMSNELYISGESYAGIYVPYVVDRIHIHNLGAAASDKLNLKGFMVGNGCTNWNYDTTPSFVEMSYWYGLISQELHEKLEANNCYEEYTPYSETLSLECW